MMMSANPARAAGRPAPPAAPPEQRWYARTHGEQAPDLRVAYFCAEFGLATELPIYSGGLGVLAGDHLKSAADLGVPLVGVGLLYRQGYFTQHVTSEGEQDEHYAEHEPAQLPVVLQRDAAGEPIVVSFPMLDHEAYAQVWRYDVGSVPLYLLDTDIAQNRPEHRRITDRLYGGDNEQRLRQEIALGIGGMRALVALGITPTVIHLNEGHAAFAAVERARMAMEGSAHFNRVAREMTAGVVFTTHTPVPAGHDMFPVSLMERYLGGYVWQMREPWRRFLALGRHDPTDDDEPFNMTLLALRLSSRRNGVSRLHGEVSRRMWLGVWPGLTREHVPIGHITNGVHVPTWLGRPVRRVLKDALGQPLSLEPTEPPSFDALGPAHDTELWSAHRQQKRELMSFLEGRLAVQFARHGESPDELRAVHGLLDPDALVIGFARRFATYKRADLLFSDESRLARLLSDDERPVQVVIAGKAHPADRPGQSVIQRIFELSRGDLLRGRVFVVEDYDMRIARFLVGGVDVWLNNPRRPLEASGTSGMKAAINGVPSVSILDGWWDEGYNGENGWAIGGREPAGDEATQDASDAAELYRLLEEEIVPRFFARDAHGVPREWVATMRAAIAAALWGFSTARMLREYLERLYLPAVREPAAVA
jgi:glycogen phosphorylase